MIFEQQGLTEKLYTKADLLNHVGEIDNPAITNTDQIWAGAFMLRKCKEITDFVNRWYDVCHNHFELITDKDSKLPNAKGFITHRHDQSAFSVLVKGYHLAVVSANETFTTGNFQDELADFPIWATRKRQYTWWYLKKDGLKKRLNKLFNK